VSGAGQCTGQTSGTSHQQQYNTVFAPITSLQPYGGLSVLPLYSLMVAYLYWCFHIVKIDQFNYMKVSSDTDLYCCSWLAGWRTDWGSIMLYAKLCTH